MATECNTMDEEGQTDTMTSLFNPSSQLEQLPNELMRYLYSFLDVPSLGTMAQLHTGALQKFATEDSLWTQWVSSRFHVATSKRPKLLGGRDWKDAYRSMHLCHRMPKSRYTNHKAIFAKPKVGNASPTSKTSSSSSCPLAVWVTLNHTENCRTRRLRGTRNEDERRYVEFWVCLQNTKSNGTIVEIDVQQAVLQMVGSHGDCYQETALNELLSCGYRWIVPRVLHHHKRQSAKATTSNWNLDSRTLDNIIRLKPLEFCVVSIPFECLTQDDIFETDVLARTVALQIPFVASLERPAAPFSARKGKQPFAFSGCINSLPKQQGAPDNIGICTYAEDNENTEDQQLATAWFVPENDVWEHYCELPGGCLTLSDRERRLHL